MTKITASRATPFLRLCYTLFVDRIQDKGKPDEEMTLEISRLAKEVLPEWGPAIPALRDILLSILKGKQKDESFIKLGLILKQLVPQGKGDAEVPSQELELLQALGAYFRTGSETAKAKLMRFASMSKSPFVVQRLAPKVGNQQTSKQALEQLVKSLVGRRDTALTMEEAPRVKEVNPDAYKAYLSLRKDFNQAWRDALVSFIRKSGNKTVPFKDALNYLRLNGIEHMLPLGFTGHIDDLARFYSNKGKMIDGVPNAVTFPSVVMNPNFGKPDGGDWVFVAQRADGTAGPYFYTSEFKKGQSKAKFAKVADLSKKIEGMRKKWVTKLKNFDAADSQSVASVVLEILYEFAARIGSAGNSARGTSTFGVATLLAKHAILTPDGNVTLRYKGKDGVATTHKIVKNTPVGKMLIEAINELLIDKEPRERLFTIDKGTKKVPITPAQVNQFFKACGAPEGVTVHKLRTLTGTRIFKELMDAQFAKRRPKTEAQAKLLFNKLAEAVGKKLNHVRNGASGTKVTGATALSAYIDVSIQLEYWLTLGFRVPKSLEKFDEALAHEHAH